MHYLKCNWCWHVILSFLRQSEKHKIVIGKRQSLARIEDQVGWFIDLLWREETYKDRNSKSFNHQHDEDVSCLSHVNKMIVDLWDLLKISVPFQVCHSTLLLFLFSVISLHLTTNIGILSPRMLLKCNSWEKTRLWRDTANTFIPIVMWKFSLAWKIQIPS